MPSGNETVISSTSVPQDQDTVTIDPEADKALKYWEYLFTLKGPLGYLIPGFAFLSGDIILVITIIMVICSMPFVRRSGKFEVSWNDVPSKHKMLSQGWFIVSNSGPTLIQHWLNICITFKQCWTNVKDIGPTLYKCYKCFVINHRAPYIMRSVNRAVLSFIY